MKMVQETHLACTLSFDTAPLKPPGRWSAQNNVPTQERGNDLKTLESFLFYAACTCGRVLRNQCFRSSMATGEAKKKGSISSQSSNPSGTVSKKGWKKGT